MSDDEGRRAYRRFRRRGRRPRVFYTSPSPQPIVFQQRTEDALFTQHYLGTEPHRPDKPGNDHCNYGLERIALHAPEDDDPISGRFDLVAVDFELMTKAKPRDLAFDQALGRLRQCALGFANADR